MNSKLFRPSSFPSLLCVTLVILVKIQSSLSDEDGDDDDHVVSRQSCDVPFRCGNITAGYPFWGNPGRPQECGAHQELMLECLDDDDHVPTMVINGVYYWVLYFNSTTQTLRIARKDYGNGICSPEYPNTTINSELFDYSEAYENFTIMYDCPTSKTIPVHFPCPGSNGVKYKEWSIVVGVDGPGECKDGVVVPFPRKLKWTKMTNPLDLGKILKEGFVLQWKVGGVPCKNCTNSEGSCGPWACAPSPALRPSSVLSDEAPKLSPDPSGTNLN